MPGLIVWRNEEAYKPLKHRIRLERVSGLIQHAAQIDVYAEVLADNLKALVCMVASEDADLAASNRSCHRAHTGACLQRAVTQIGDGAGVPGGLVGEGIWFARGKFT